jgi:hypothetical protein
LYFDDFRDKIPGRIEIPAASQGGKSEWLEIIDQLFRQTDRSFDVMKLPELEERQRKTVLAKVSRHLNDTLTKEWQTFRLDDREALKVSIEFKQEQLLPTPPAGIQPAGQPLAQLANLATQLAQQAGNPNLVLQTTEQVAQLAAAQQANSQVAQSKSYIKLDVVETDSKGDEHYFYISDRSKGFYWFFNFVMKLEFNPKFVADEDHTIYLLDEPGSYLHAFAQRKLCHKLRQLSVKNWVAYCTHSHYLLDPEVIPVNKIKVADKDGDGGVSLIPIMSYPSSTTEKRSALQPVLDALQVTPFALDLIGNHRTLITEGIYDYLAIEMFRGGRKVSILPSVGADSIKFFISLMIAWQVEFRAIWDNDPEGRQKREEAARYFGDEIADKFLKLLPFGSQTSKTIIQNLFDGQDLVKVRQELGLDAHCSFERTIQALFYSSRRGDLVNGMSQATRDNFSKVFESLGFVWD